jgi:hypothetical protein
MPAAVVDITETNGPAGSPTVTPAISNINFGSGDAPNLTVSALLNPIVLSASARTWSWGKWLQFHVNTANGHSISNLKVWKSAGAYTGPERIATNMNDTAGTGLPGPGGNSIVAYATGSLGNGGGAVVTPYNTPCLPVVAKSFSNWYTAAIITSLPGTFNLSVNGSASSSTAITVGTNPGTGGGQAQGYSDFVFLLLDVDGSSGSVQGPLGPYTISFTYDET